MISKNFNMVLILISITLQSCLMAETEKATFAGGCFWCMEHPFDEIEGVKDVISGYTGGHLKNPSYEDVVTGTSGHLEAVQITFDPEKINYEELVEHFWRQVNPTDDGGQFVDRGSQYRPAIFFHSDEQRIAAENSKKQLNSSGRFDKPVVTEVIRAEKFYPAEEYHQNYYKKCPLPYKGYRMSSGRDQFLKKVWFDEEIKQKEQKKLDQSAETKDLKNDLTPLQYAVTQQCGTEPPFNNAYWDNKREGIYVDVISGKPLFSSIDKYDSGSGWPAFTKPLNPQEIEEVKDKSLGMVRTEVKSKNSDSHLGHVFEDGPDENGLRYCINSASLRFIPKENLEEEGYGEYSGHFDK